MLEKEIQPKVTFTICYRDEILKVDSKDQIVFGISFPDGKIIQITFDIDYDMDLRWTYLTGEASTLTKETGSLIELALLKEK